MPFHLKRVSDGAGDGGSRSESIAWAPDGKIKAVEGYVPKVGNSMLVGSITARSYSSQDYWLTTPVTEILKEVKTENLHYVKFKTGNSVYEWWTGELSDLA